MMFLSITQREFSLEFYQFILFKKVFNLLLVLRGNNTIFVASFRIRLEACPVVITCDAMTRLIAPCLEVSAKLSRNHIKSIFFILPLTSSKSNPSSNDSSGELRLGSSLSLSSNAIQQQM